MNSGSTGSQGSSAFIIPVWYSGSWECPKCGRNIAKRYIAIIRHQNCCTGKMKTMRKWAQKGSKYKWKNIEFVFYHDCRIHALSKAEMAKYLCISLRALNRRMKDGWTLRQLLKIDEPKDDCKGGNPTGINVNTDKKLTKQEYLIQNMLMRKKK